MKLRSLTDIGIKRKDNQDNYWSARLSVEGEEVGVICLCDGMGGLDKGGLASKTVVEAVKNFFSSDIDMVKLRGVLSRANDDLYDISKMGNISLGTTCTVILIKAGVYEILHIGDSRCYHFSKSKGDKLTILTKDHTVVEKYKQSGRELPPSLLKKYQNTLTRCIGVSSRMELDYYTGTYSDDDIFLVCSDGFWHHLSSEDFGNLDDLESLVKKYIAMGETDNITAVWIGV